MKTNALFLRLGAVCLIVLATACKIPEVAQKEVSSAVPASYNSEQDTTNSATTTWRQYFTDPYLTALIDTALKNNQELNIMLWEISIANNEVMARKGEYQPMVDVGAGAELEKVGRYTSQGANDANTDIDPGTEFPEPLPDFAVGAYAHWEVDIWKKLRNAKKAAAMRYLASVEGKNFMVTNLVAEIAGSYYELVALDNQLATLQQNIAIQENALEVVRLQKQSAKVTELAVRKFEAEVLKNQSLVFTIRQQIIETENRINFLVGRFPQPILRDASALENINQFDVYAGVPAQLLQNRPDIRQAELELEAAKLDVQVAKANFYPSLDISARLGLQAFNPTYLAKAPESLLYTLAGDLAAPLINRKAIKAAYASANARQLQAIYAYEQAVLIGYLEVQNQLANLENLQSSFELKDQQVHALMQSISIANNLFRSARADYMEVLLTQRDALEARMELIETQMLRMEAAISIYRALGGGWR